jgi:hypothetical protein
MPSGIGDSPRPGQGPRCGAHQLLHLASQLCERGTHNDVEVRLALLATQMEKAVRRRVRSFLGLLRAFDDSLLARGGHVHLVGNRNPQAGGNKCGARIVQ